MWTKRKPFLESVLLCLSLLLTLLFVRVRWILLQELASFLLMSCGFPEHKGEQKGKEGKLHGSFWRSIWDPRQSTSCLGAEARTLAPLVIAECNRGLKAAFAEEHWLLTSARELTKGRKDDCDASFPQQWKEQIDSGKNVTGTTKGKIFWYSQLACWPLYSACYSNRHFFPLCFHAGEPKVNILHSSVKLQSSPPYLSLTTKEVNLSAKTYSLGDVAPRHLENQGWHLLWDMHFCHTCELSPWA
jgi:hypothetical protein